MTQTTFSDKCDILAELWLEHRESEGFEDFISYNDLGMPLAYAISSKIIEPSSTAQILIEETFRLFLERFAIEDTGFDTLEDVFDYHKA
jgi:hypothetical protein